MNKNSTVRKQTSERARELNQALQIIVENEKFDKFDLHYLDNPLTAVMKAWKEKGGQLHELIEPVDSMHPTQAAQPLIAEEVWRQMETKFPHVLGPVNPNNHVIKKLFGDQG